METDYWNALDQRKIAEDVGIDPAYIGMGSHAFKDQLAELKAKTFMGAKRFELAFAGKGAGIRTRGQTTPGSIGKTEREMTREMAKINEVELSTHACINIAGFSGLTEKGFNDEEKQKNIGEIKRAVDFAADTTQGGPVVIHTGEFPRPVYKPEDKFEAYPEEKKKMPVYLADKKTGGILSLPKDLEINIPKEYDEKTGTFKFEKRTYDYYENEKNKQKLIEKFKEEGIIKPEEKPTSAQLFYLDYLRKDKEQHEWEERRWGNDYETLNKKYKELKEDAEEISKFSKDRAEYKAIKLAEKMGVEPAPGTEAHKEWLKDPVNYLNKSIDKVGRQVRYYKDASTSYGERVRDTIDKMKQIKPIENVAIERSAESIANLGMYALEKEKKRGLKKPLFIAPENFMPETYGAHPKELRNIILKSRQAMAKKLQTEGYSNPEAKKIASDHIKATFDIGHANLWKKYFQGPEKEFNSWLKNQISQLTKEGIIGHVHLTDNFGYYDEHLAPGEGSIPVKDFVDEIKKQGYKGSFIVEAGYEEGKEHEALTGAFRTLNSPIYRTEALSQTWSDIQTSYFARTSGTPGYLVGDYAPSKDWTLWSEVPLE